MKPKSCLLLLLFILFTKSNYSQLQQVDSLLSLINKTTSAQKKADYLNTLGNAYQDSNQDSAFKYISKARKIAESNMLPIQLAESYNTLGIIWYNKKLNDSAFYYLEKGYHIAKKNTNYKEMVKSLYTRGRYKSKLNEYKIATDLFKEAISYINQIKDQRTLSMLYNNLAIFNKTNGKLNVALEYYHKALKIAEEQNDPKTTGLVTSNIGLLYEAQNKTDLALQYLNQSLAIRIKQNNKVGESYVRTNLGLVFENLEEYDKALIQYRKSLCIKEAINNERGMSILYNNMGIIFRKQNVLDSAIYYSSKSLALRIKLKDKTGEARTRATLGQIYLQQNKPKQAKKELLKAKKLSHGYRNHNVLKNINLALYQVSVSLHEYKNATNYLLTVDAYKDSIFYLEQDKNITTIEAKYQILKKEKENLVLMQENELQDEKIKHQLLIGVILVSTIIIILVLLILIYRSRYLLTEKNAKIGQQAKELTKTLHEIKQLSKFKESMTNMLVHDLKTPLNVIVNYKALKKFDSHEELLKKSGYTMLNLVHNILDVYKYHDSKIEVQKKNILLSTVLNKAFEEITFLVKENKHQFSIKSECDFNINVDEKLLKRVFVNLFTNAIKFTPSNKTIRLEFIVPNNGNLRIELYNPGPRIPKEQQELIFEYFKQANNKNYKNNHSSGLGLSFCKLAVEGHQGSIGVISENDFGVIFWIELPEVEKTKSVIPNFQFDWLKRIS